MRYHLYKVMRKHKKIGDRNKLLVSLQEYDDLLNALSIISNSLTRCQRKDSLEPRWRIESGYVILSILLCKAFSKSHI